MMLGIVSGGATTHESPTNVECSLKYRISCVVLRTSNVRQLHSGAPLLSYNLRILYTRFGTSILFSFTFRSRHYFPLWLSLHSLPPYKEEQGLDFLRMSATGGNDRPGEVLGT